jgi:hypothetical protein
MQSARIIVGLFAISCLLAGCDGGSDGTTTAPPGETKANVEAALQKARRPGPTGKGGAPASPSTK